MLRAQALAGVRRHDAQLRHLRQIAVHRRLLPQVRRAQLAHRLPAPDPAETCARDADIAAEVVAYPTTACAERHSATINAMRRVRAVSRNVRRSAAAAATPTVLDLLATHNAQVDRRPGQAGARRDWKRGARRAAAAVPKRAELICAAD